MKNRFLSYSFSLLLLSTSLFGDVSGTGYGETIKLAKVEALADLSQVIKSEVRTIYKSQSNDVSAQHDFKAQVSSNLPILGVEFRKVSSGELIAMEALLRSKRVEPLYISKFSDLNREMKSILKAIKSSKSKSFILKEYAKLYALVKEYDRYKSVFILLDSDTKETPIITASKVQLEISKLKSNIDSLSLATTLLAAGIKEKGIYVYPPHINSSSSIAEFGSIFATRLKGKLDVVNELTRAKYILVGEYNLSKKKMILNMQLLDVSTKKIVESKTLVINAKAYRGMALKPKGIDFNRLLTQGVAESSSLKVRLNSNRGSENLLFHKNDEVELFVKLNKMGYLYIVGYTQTKGGKFSYLLELSEGEGNSRFVKFVNADDASKWISLGVFNVEAPYGVESLQVIASNKRIKKVPNVTYDDELGYYVISNKIKKALEHTRGLRPKRSKKVESSEDVISFTTMK